MLTQAVFRLPSILIGGLLACAPVSAQTVLSAGDLAIVAINANNVACSGLSAQDEISFFCFKAITVNTRIWITDCGYEHTSATKWGNTEGVFELKRNTSTLAANVVVTMRVTSAGGVSFVSPDVNWTVTNLNSFSSFNLNSGGDQVIFLQPLTAPAGVYSQGTVNTNNATFTNCTFLYGFSTVAAPNDWVSFAASTQRSGLPPGSLCFSMSPAGSTDFVKYVAPLPDAFPVYTLRTQRQWIIEIDDNTRWVSEGNCATYNTPSATSPNYAGGFTFPVTAGGFVNGRWTGAKNTDWFDCRNWDDAEIPISTSPVLIDPVYAPINSCVVGVNVAPPTAYCQTLTLNSAGAARNLTVQNGAVLQVGGAVNVTRTSFSGPVGVTMLNGTLTATNLNLTGNAGQQAYFRNEVIGNTVAFNGNIQINAGGELDLQGAGVGGTVSLTGNYTNNADAVSFDELYSTLNFNGAGSQSINTLGSFTENFGSVALNKASNDLTLNTAITVQTTLTMNGGRLMTSTPNMVTLSNVSNVNGASLASFVHGPMTKIGNINFAFRIGKGTVMRPVTLSLLTGGATDAFVAEYFPADPHTSIGVPIESPPLDHISYCEYWIVNRAAGTPNAWVRLNWLDPQSCGVTSGFEAQMRVAKWDTTMWRDKGNSLITGNYLNGTVTTSVQQTAFGAFTLASLVSQNPLPIELMYFVARPDGKEVKLDWATATEINNDYFTVERSDDGVTFTDLMRVDGSGNSTSTINYTDQDRWPLSGVSYYRLRQTDYDGTSTHSDIVTVQMSGKGDQAITVMHDGSSVFAVHDFAVGSSIEVMDMTGRVVQQGKVTSEGRTLVPVNALIPGAYLLRMSDGTRSESTRFVL